MRRRASPRCASAAAWASLCALHATKRTAANAGGDEKIISQPQRTKLIRNARLTPGALFLMLVKRAASFEATKKSTGGIRHGTSCIGNGRNARHRRFDQQGAEGRGLQ